MLGVILTGAVVVGGAIALLGSPPKKKKSASKATSTASDPLVNEIAEAEARGEIVVTDDGDVVAVADVDAAAAEELERAEANGDAIVSDDGGAVAVKGEDPRTWTLQPIDGEWFAEFIVAPTISPESLRKLLDDAESEGDAFFVDETADGVTRFVSWDNDPMTFTVGKKVGNLPATLIDLRLLTRDEFTKLSGGAGQVWNTPEGGWWAHITLRPDGVSTQKLVRKLSTRSDSVMVGVEANGDVRIVGHDDDAVEIRYGQTLPDVPGRIVAFELITPEEADAMVRGANASEDQPEINADPPSNAQNQGAAALEAAEAAGEIEVTEDGDVIPAAPPAPTAEELAAAEAAGEIEVTEDGDVILIVPPEAQALADLLIQLERTNGSHWKSSAKDAIAKWQKEQGTDYLGRNLAADGSFGPTSALTLASRGVDVIPLVRYWPKGAQQERAVQEYKLTLQSIQTAHPEAVQVALQRERGQGFGTAAAIPQREWVE